MVATTLVAPANSASEPVSPESATSDGPLRSPGTQGRPDLAESPLRAPGEADASTLGRVAGEVFGREPPCEPRRTEDGHVELPIRAHEGESLIEGPPGRRAVVPGPKD